MKNRTYIVVANNAIAGNKPLGIGNETSYVNLFTTTWAFGIFH